MTLFGRAGPRSRRLRSFLRRRAVAAPPARPAMDAKLRHLVPQAGGGRFNRGRPADEQARFSYGIGYGDLLDLDGDTFGLEVNLASKMGENLARPGEILLTPGAVANLDAPGAAGWRDTSRAASSTSRSR